VKRDAFRLLAVTLAYVAGAQLGLALALHDSQVTPWWPPTGIALAAMLVWGRRMWPAVAVGAVVVNVAPSHHTLGPLLVSVGNVLAPLTAAYLLERLGFDTRMVRLRDATALVATGATCTVVSATVGVGALLLDGLPPSRGLEAWATWWTGDALGALVVTPFLLCLRVQRSAGWPSRRRALEASALLALTALVTFGGFRNEHGLRFVVFPIIAVAAIRFQLRGAAPAALLATFIASHAAATGDGPFAHLQTLQIMIALQAFNACVTFLAYLLAALTSDRQRAYDELSAQGGLLERVVEERTQQLTGALERLTQAQQIARMGSLDIDAGTGQVQWSLELCRLVGRELGSPMSLEAHVGLCHPSEREQLAATVRHGLSTGEPFAMDHRLRHADGSYRWLHCQGHAVVGDDGRVVGMRATATDIQERKTMESWFEQLVELAPDAMVFVDRHGDIKRVNVQAETVFGYSREELIDRPVDTLLPGRFRRLIQQSTAYFPGAGHRSVGQELDLHARRKDGSQFPVEVSLSQLETQEGTLVATAIRDTTERKRQRDELAYRGLHDALTGLPNRVLLMDRLAQATATLRRHEGQHVAVVFLDLDRFKWVNDSLGHESGDELLQAVAERLTSVVRAEDSVARFGGDEFVIVGSGLRSADEALVLAERLREAVTLPVELPGGHVVVPTMSIGVATTDDACADPAELLRDADAAMYRAKEQGRDRTSLFAPEIHTQMRTRLATAGGLRAAVGSNQLRVHYQPIVDLESGRPLAVEALVRWQHPTRGLLLPGDFIGLAEETGQIGEIDRAVLVTACREFGLLAAEHPTLSLNVNVSLQHLSRPLLRDALIRGLAEGGLSPAQLTVEVTESADLSGEEFAQLLATVKELGIKVAIDDFGTGFSALSRLNGLGVDRIKVDRSFVRHVHEDERSQLLVAAMTQLAGALGAGVVAEGIEEPVQAEVLQRLGCEAGQGYLWSRPVELDALATWIRRQRKLVRVPAPRSEVQEPSVASSR